MDDSKQRVNNSAKRGPGILVKEPDGKHRQGIVYDKDRETYAEDGKLPVYLVNKDMTSTGERIIVDASKWRVQGYVD